MPDTGRLRRWALLAGMALAVAAGAGALEVTAVDGEAGADPVQQLIEELGSDAWRTRQAAQEALVAMGQAIRPRIEQLLAGADDEEVRSRAQAVLRGLDEGRMSGPTLVTIRLASATPRQVFAELARQGYTEIHPNPPDLLDSGDFAPADFDISGELFWSAMLQACRTWDLSAINASPGVLSLTRIAAAPATAITTGRSAERIVGLAPCQVNGAFLVSAINISRTHTVDLSSRENIRRYCGIQILVLPEPKVRILQGSSTATITEAVDEHGNNLRPPVLQHDTLQSPYSPFWFAHCQLAPPLESGVRLARLRGFMRFVVQTRVETGQIDNPLAARNAQATVAGRRFILQSLTQKGDAYIARITAQRAGANNNEFSGVNAPIQFQLLDEQGVPLGRQGLPQMRGATPEQVEIEVQFQRMSLADGPSPGEPARLIWDVPVDSREIEVAFEFKDLPLP
jgi:hypothetical protein